MPPVAGIFDFDIPGHGLWVDDQSLGLEVARRFQGREVRLRLPELPSGPIPPGVLAGDAMTGASVRGEDGGGSRGLRAIRLEVRGEANFGSGDFRDSDAAPLAEASLLIESLRGVAETFVWEFLNQARGTLGQFWVGTSTDPPRMTGSSLIDLDTDEPIPVIPPIESQALGLGSDAGITPDQVEHLATRASEASEVPLPDELIADAKYLAYVRKPPDARLAVLLAAIACEAQIKRRLNSLVAPGEDSRALLALILENPRDVTLAVVTHFDKTAKAVVGRSLREENKPLWKHAERLFEIRNEIAHGRGKQASEGEQRQAINCAGELFAWMDTLRRSATDA
jgi:hypothetical protein